MLLALLLAALPAQAEEATGEPLARARALSDWGRAAYAAGDYQGSLQAYLEAYTAVPLAAFLFNIAQAHRQLGDYAHARFFYRRFLDEVEPAAAERSVVLGLLREMDARQRDQEVRMAMRLTQTLRTSPLDTAPPRQLQGQGPLWQQWWFWTGVGVAVVGGGAAALWALPPGGASGAPVAGR